MSLVQNSHISFIKPLVPLNWKPLKIEASTPMETQLQCLICHAPLETIASLVNRSIHIRMGACLKCKYIGYIDRPSEEWLNDFYSKDFSYKNCDKYIQNLSKYRQPSHVSQSLLKQAYELTKSNRGPILDLGCGYGDTLSYMHQLGFRDLTGIENSKQRAQIAQTKTGLAILEGSFGDPRIQNKLMSKAHYSLIYSHHVLEHTYNPSQVLKQISRLQKPDDLLILCVPNFDGEESLATLMFLPHLHSFTKTSLTRLLAKHGYEVISHSYSNNKNINLMAQKKKNAFLIADQTKIDLKEITLKLKKNLCADQLTHNTPCQLIYPTGKFPGNKPDPFIKNYLMSDKIRDRFLSSRFIFARIKEFFIKPGAYRSFLIKKSQKRKTSSPLEIQFEKDFYLFVR